MPTFAAVDIGSNSVRLKIAKTVRGRLQTLHDDREVTRLGESVFASGTLDPQAMSQTLQVLRRFHRAVQTYAADRVRVVATSALRDARNSRAFLDWVRSATGWKAEIISGLEEGRLIHLGVLSNARIAGSRALLIDLGGGSCELTISIQGHIEDMVSLPIGAVRLTQTFLHHDPPKKKELQQLRGFIQREVSRIQKRITDAKLQISIATSGTPAALSGLYAAKIRGYNESKPQTVPKAAVATLLNTLSRRAGVWTNSFCGHPAPGEAMDAAIARRAQLELGITVSGIEPMLPDFRYRAVDASGIVENEICPVFRAVTSDAVRANPDEVAEWQWVEPRSLRESVAATPFAFSPWLVLQLAP